MSMVLAIAVLLAEFQGNSTNTIEVSKLSILEVAARNFLKISVVYLYKKKNISVVRCSQMAAL